MAEDPDTERKINENRNADTKQYSSHALRKESLHQPVIQPGEKKTPPFQRTTGRAPAEPLQPDHDWLTGESNIFKEEQREETAYREHAPFEAWGGPSTTAPLKNEDFFLDDYEYEEHINFLSEKLDRCKRLQWLLLGALLVATVANVLLLML